MKPDLYHAMRRKICTCRKAFFVHTFHDETCAYRLELEGWEKEGKLNFLEEEDEKK